MKLVYSYVVFFLVVVAGLISARQTVTNPERLIIGAWTEKEWAYEKIHTIQDLRALAEKDTISQAVKDQLGKHLLIHSAEVWEFKDDGTLLLSGNSVQRQARWKLKGRGHLLELEYADGVMEHYTLTELAEGRMILNFDSDIQVRGIAKLTFDRVKEENIVKKI